MWSWARRVLMIGVPIGLVGLVWRDLQALDIERARAVLAGAEPQKLALGVGTALAAVVVMGFYDALAFARSAAGRLGFWRRWVLGALLCGWTNLFSIGPLGGAALRLVAYRRWGFTAPEITWGFAGSSMCSFAGLIAWLVAVWLPLGQGADMLAVRVMMALFISISLPILVSRVLIPIVQWHRFAAELDRLPLVRIGMVSFADWGLTLLSFWWVSGAVGVSASVVGAARTVLTGQLAGLISMLPGGLGSADAIWLIGLGRLGAERETAAAAVMAFRSGFYLVPWCLSLIGVYLYLIRHSPQVQVWQRRIVAGAVMLNAVLLLLSSATPTLADRLGIIEDVVPLGAIELSHAIAVGAAATMLYLVRGLIRGYRSAYLFAVAMLLASVVAHLLKGADFEESLSSLFLLLMMLGVRGAYQRQGRFPIGWELTLSAGVGALTLFLVSGFAAFERIPYRPDLWITFATRAEASRFLRGSLILVLVALVAIVRQATKPVGLFVVPSPDEIDEAEAFAREHAESADALLVGGGDKGVWFFHDPRKSGQKLAMFLFQRWSDRLIVFRDPVVRADVDPASAINAFLEHCDRLDVEPVFYSISSEWMSHLHDFGFYFLKLSQEAVVPLEGFTLQGKRNAGFRRALRDMEQAGVVYELLQPPFDDGIMNQLRQVSDAWLAAKGGRELQFSACYFSPQYINRHPVGVARDANGQIVAFVNVLMTRPGGPATVDLMRYRPGLMDNLMDFVLIRTMQTLAEQGASSFSLGNAPLSDVGVWRGSRLVERAMHAFSRRAGRLYNYQGLVHYKSKFHPKWKPRYLAYRQPWEWAASLLAVAGLVRAQRRSDRRRIALARVGRDS